MKPVKAAGLLATMLLAGCVVTVNDRVLVGKDRVALWQEKLVIAHRGASGYLPEHTLAAKAMAYAQGAHFIEQDLVMTQDDQVVVLHDHHLDTVTDVYDVFPGRARADGRYYVIDFTLAELRQLAVSERFRESDGVKTAVFEQRFPLEKSSFRINTFAEEIELIQGLNQSTGRLVGIYPEIKSPAFHRGEGKDISAAVLEVLKTYGYDEQQDRVFLQCFDANELQRIRGELFPAMNMSVPLVQLLGTGPNFRPALTSEGMKTIASYANGIGPSMQLIVEPGSVAGKLKTTNLVDLSHDLGLVVHPYTFRRDLLPAYAADYGELLEIFLDDIGVDGVFTDFPDLTVEYIESNL
ncbi:MAG: glycerophosphodiester phosphodiesterase [Gammaproteobacteria bacterium]|nr:glycerophosphodiester phosphodiesterase [Gammaproteobacteria bacterium]